MRFKSLRLINYIGIYNGIGLNEIFIDFTKCKYNTIIIRGDNGSGKSTIYNALTPLPDSNDNFIPGLPASKEIEIIDNGIIYSMKFIHNIKNNGDRDTTKAYLYKTINNQTLDMNPNGNVTSFKELLYEEFNLDSNFIALSELSSGNKGIADKRPGERKKFATAIIENLEVYNGINKTLTKKHNVFKSMMNNISNKLGNIGDKNTLDIQLKSIDKELERKLLEKDNLTTIISDNRSILKLIDPTQEIQNAYHILLTDIEKLTKEAITLESGISNLYKRYDLDNNIDIVDAISKLSSTIDSNKNRVEILTNNNQMLLQNREQDLERVEEKNARYQSYNGVKEVKELTSTINSYKKKLKEYDVILSKMGMNNISITKDEYISGVSILTDIRDNLSTVKDQYDETIINTVLIEYINSYVDNDIIRSLGLVRAKQSMLLNETIAEFNHLSKEYENSKEILDNRPTKCKLDDCSFINKATKVYTKEVATQISKLQKEIEELQIDIETSTKDIDKLNNINECAKIINSTLRSILNNKSLISKFSIFKDMSEIEILNILINNATYNSYIQSLEDNLNYANILEEYNIINNSLEKLQINLKIAESRNAVLDDLMDDINALNKRIDSTSTNIEENNNTIQSIKKELLLYEDRYNKLKILLNNMDTYNNIMNELNKQNEKFHKVRVDIDKILEANDIVVTSTSKLDIIINEINKLSERRSNIEYNLRLIDEYRHELEEYNSNYIKTERLKYYSSINTGIQLVFMEIYMANILKIANSLLAHLFEGRFVIQEFIINETEFKIPCLGNGYMNDDISSLSDGELSMMSMIISFSLLHCSSTKYNILKLDEIDAPLDHYNRRQFVVVLERLINILQCEQCIIISHNTELNTSNVDMIVLKNSTNDNINGNIIYQY